MQQSRKKAIFTKTYFDLYHLVKYDKGTAWRQAGECSYRSRNLKVASTKLLPVRHEKHWNHCVAIIIFFSLIFNEFDMSISIINIKLNTKHITSNL